MCENKFYICGHCGNIVGLIKNAGVPLMPAAMVPKTKPTPKKA